MVEKNPQDRRLDRHKDALNKIASRDKIEISSKQFVRLMLHLQVNSYVQNSMIRAIAAVASGSTDWDEIEEIARFSVNSSKILDDFVFDVAELKADDE